MIQRALITIALWLLSVAALAADPIPVRVVVATMFENGAPRGDEAGELQLWLERNPTAREMEFPLGEYPLYVSDEGVLWICVGGGIPNATASIMALGLDERFDLSRAYWLIAGIAGGDPQDVSLGSAVWADHVVDGDLVYEIDAREIPKDWAYGFIPLGAKAPAEGPQDVTEGWTLDTIHFALNADLAAWAYQLTRNTPLLDTPAMREFRDQFVGLTNGRRAPFITRGDTLSASTYWHGKKLNEWANDWLHAYAGLDAEFMTSNMEDSGTLTALHRLERLGRVDTQRVLVLRTVSNYTLPPEGRSAAWSTTAEYPDGGLGALDTAQRVGQQVVDELIDNWSRYAEALPEAAARTPVIFDTDMAIDDWAALLFLARHPAVDLRAVTVAGSGEAHCEPAVRNALALLDLVNPHSTVPVTCGDDYPIDGHFVFPVPWQKDMDRLSGVAVTGSDRDADGRHAVELLHDTLADSEEAVTLLATGPLTNIAQWLQRFPEDMDAVDRLVVMGGNMDAPGNIIVPDFTDDNPNTRAEWNIYVDPVAADQVLRSSLAIELVGLDVTNQVQVTQEFAAAFKARVDNPGAVFWDAVLDANDWFINSGEYYFWDVLAALVVIDRDRYCQGEQLALQALFEETGDPWWPTSDRDMPSTLADGSARKHFAAQTAGVLVPREGKANVLYCRETDAQSAFREFFNTLSGPDGAVTLESLP
jgi:purine nucleoside permease/inosine-uridine nucleoside N-ribohydrolase